MFPNQLENPTCRAGTCDEAERIRCSSVGCQNIAAARGLLGSADYSIRVEDVGGHGSRHVTFDVPSGEVWIQRGAVIAPVAEVTA
jgi:chemotaxis receptor (MCP) glutamine deamidase CheD